MEKRVSSAARLSVPEQLIERSIYVIRGQKVMLDRDLAELYEVPTKRLNEFDVLSRPILPGLTRS